MGRSKAAPVQQKATLQEPSKDNWLGRRTVGCSPEDLLRRELLEEDQLQQSTRRQLFEEDDCDEEDVPDSDSDDSQDIIVTPTSRKRPSSVPKKKTKCANKRVVFSEQLAADVPPPEFVLSMDQVDPSLTMLEYHPRADAANESDAAMYLVRILDLPNTWVDCGTKDDVKQPSTVPITTSLGVSDIWKHYSLPGIDALEHIVACFRQSFIAVKIRPASDGIKMHIYLTHLALNACNALNLPATLNNNPQLKHRQRADQLRVVLASLFSDISSHPPPCTSPDVAARQIYKIVDNFQLQAWLDKKKPSQSQREFPGLVPTLRPYQEAAVEWMLEREQAPVESREWELSWVVLSDCERGDITFLPDYVAAQDSRSSILYNQFTGWLATSYDEARAMTIGGEALVVRGGMLAESMGLGKTVEVLACVLGNQRRSDDNVISPVTDMACAHIDPQTISVTDEGVDIGESMDVQRVGYVGDLDDIGDADDSSDDESLPAGPRRDISASPIAVTSAVPVTPEKASDIRHKVREEWIDDDELGSCICGKIIGFLNSDGREIVVCSSCREPMHKQCAPGERSGFLASKDRFDYRQRFTNKTIHAVPCDERVCPTCVASKEPIESGATLIITPAAILDQWRREISRHISRERGLNVVVYEGVKTSQSKHATPASIQLLHPSVLGKADIVLMTFDSLMSDLGHSDDNRFVAADSSQAQLRRRKRYRVIASPLICIKWWRIILDEAQRVETPTAGSARMAVKLASYHRWAVTGTPLGRGKLDDLFGLLLFLRLDPFAVKQLFNRCFQQGHGSLERRIAHLLNQTMWRSTKALPLVSQQLGLLDQTEQKVILRFSSIEKHFYNQQLQDALSVVGDLRTETKNGKKRKAAQLVVTDRLYRLRAACCHPQVGSGGVSHAKRLRQTPDGTLNSVSRRVMTMEQILITFIDDARLKCEEAQRLVVMHRNAVAAISRLKVEAKQRDIVIPDSDLHLLSRSRDLYLDALKLVKNNSTPTLILGEAHLFGTMGFCSTLSQLKNGAGILAWQAFQHVPMDMSASIDFLETAKKVTQIRVSPIDEVPLAIRNETSSDYQWHVLRPNECILQVQMDSVGGEFVDVAQFSLPILGHEPAQDDAWTTTSGFLTNKSKSWRVAIRSFHPHAIVQGTEYGIFVGLHVEMYEANIDNDPIQRLHALTNAITTSRSLLDLEASMEKGDETESNGTCVNHRELICSLESEGSIIEALYLERARALHKETKRKLEKATEERVEKESVLYASKPARHQQPIDCWEEFWWRDFLSALQIWGTDQQKHAVLTKLAEELHVYIEGNSQSLDARGIKKFPPFHNVHGFMTALDLRIQAIRSGMGGKAKTTKKSVQGVISSRRKAESGAVDGAVLFEFRSTRFKVSAGQHAACMNAISLLSDDPSHAEILENSNCCVCKVDWYKTGPKCKHCHLGSDLEDLTPDKVTENVLRVLGDIARSSLGTSFLNEYGDAHHVVERSKAFFELLDAQKREKVAAYRMWRVHLDLLNDMDELEQVKSSMRLTYEGEDLTELTEDEKNAVVQPVDLLHRFHDHAAKEAMAQGDLRRAQEKLRYLQGLVCGQSEEIECPICLCAFTERAVLRCGHSMCQKCLEDLQAHAKGQAVFCPKKCTLKTNLHDILLASDESKNDGTACMREVKGSYGTKVTQIVSDILGIRDLGDKGVVFSQWEDMLDIVQSALTENGVGFARADSRRSIGDSVAKFRAPDITVLLLNVKNGAEGLTLLEATHCFMVEPILNAGLDAQAISRIHRIGQLRRTFVYRYLIADTIEMKIDKIREDHQLDEEAIEEALNDGRKSAFSAGGIDGGFGSQDEVMQLLALDD